MAFAYHQQPAGKPAEHHSEAGAVRGAACQLADPHLGMHLARWHSPPHSFHKAGRHLVEAAVSADKVAAMKGGWEALRRQQCAKLHVAPAVKVGACGGQQKKDKGLMRRDCMVLSSLPASPGEPSKGAPLITTGPGRVGTAGRRS